MKTDWHMCILSAAEGKMNKNEKSSRKYNNEKGEERSENNRKDL